MAYNSNKAKQTDSVHGVRLVVSLRSTLPQGKRRIHCGCLRRYTLKLMSDIERKIKSLEVSLHQPEVRRDSKKLAELLHKEFREVGYSGSEYDLSAILNDLSSETLEQPSIWSQEFEFTHLSLKIIQVHYLSAHLKNGELTRHARRTSIWVQQGSVWLLRYHQGTPTSPFTKM